MYNKKIFFFIFIIVQTQQPSPLSVNCGGSAQTSLTAYRILCAGTSSTSNFQVVNSTPNNYFILTSNGSSTNPSFTALDSYMMTFIQSLTASASASLTFSLSTLFSNYLIVFNAIVPSTSAVLNMDWSINSGSSYLASGYTSGFNYHAYNSTTYTNVNSTSTNPLGIANSAAFSGFIILSNESGMFSGQGMYNTTGQFVEIFGANSANPIFNTIKFSPSAGTLTSGTITVYGLH